MSNAPPKHSLPARSENSSEDFWSSTDDALAQYPSEAGQSDATAEPPVAPTSPAPAPPASSERRYAASECRPDDECPTRSDAEDPTLSGIEDSVTSGIAVAQSETAQDGTSAGGLAAEIAHLQALIDGLTRK